MVHTNPIKPATTLPTIANVMKNRPRVVVIQKTVNIGTAWDADTKQAFDYLPFAALLGVALPAIHEASSKVRDAEGRLHDSSVMCVRSGFAGDEPQPDDRRVDRCGGVGIFASRAAAYTEQVAAGELRG